MDDSTPSKQTFVPISPQIIGGSGWSTWPSSIPIPEDEEEELLASEPPRRFSWRLVRREGELVLLLNINGTEVEFEGRELMGFAASMDKFVNKIFELHDEATEEVS